MTTYNVTVGFEYEVDADDKVDAAHKADAIFRDAFHIDEEVETVVMITLEEEPLATTQAN